MNGRQQDTQSSGTLVIVDDNPSNLRVLSGILQQDGYKVRPALDGHMALRSVHMIQPDLILLDIRMPGMDGYEVCRRLKADPSTSDVPVIFISAMNESKDKIQGFRVGGVDYVAKPFEAEEVLARVRTHVQLSQMQRHLEQLVEKRTNELRDNETRYRERLHASLVQTIEAVVTTLEKRDPYTAGHQRRVAELAVAIAGELGWEAQRTEGLRFGALIHDIGKISVPAEVLNRPGRLGDIEMALVRTHAEAGYEIIRGVEFPWPVADTILQHHERLDGSGYPHGLRQDEILLEARILAVADVVEAMASHRPYRPALGKDRAMEEIRSGRAAIYDEQVVDACLSLLDPGKFHFTDETVFTDESI